MPATAIVHSARLTLPRLARVGYVRGASDRVPEALRRVGVPIELLNGEAIERGDLSRFDAIVIGPRAYETDSALVENNARLLDYVRRGGLAIVQYQQQQYFNGGFAPFPLTVGGPALPAARRPRRGRFERIGAGPTRRDRGPRPGDRRERAGAGADSGAPVAPPAEQAAGE